MVFSLYNPAIVYGNMELAPPIELQLVIVPHSFQIMTKKVSILKAELLHVTVVTKVTVQTCLTIDKKK